jgi:tripartite-type tricarboxylate transporter receptor subunit TctC
MTLKTAGIRPLPGSIPMSEHLLSSLPFLPFAGRCIKTQVRTIVISNSHSCAVKIDKHAVGLTFEGLLVIKNQIFYQREHPAMRFFYTFGSILFSFLVAGSAMAQQTSRPIFWASAMAVGGSTDILAREAAKLLSESIGQTIVVEAVTGAGGVVAAQKVMSAPPDGSTFLFVTNSLIANQAMRKKPEFDLRKDLLAVSPLFEGTYGIYVTSELPITTLQELIAYSKANPGKLNYGTSGIGGGMHLFTEELKIRTGLSMLHIPYSGGAPVLVDLNANRVQMSLLDIVLAQPHVNSGKIRALAVTSKQRSPNLPNVPTTAEAGVPDYNPSFWMGLYAPTATPKPIVDRMNGALRTILTNPEVRSRYAARGYTTIWLTPEETQRKVAQELTQIAKTIEAARIERE